MKPFMFMTRAGDWCVATKRAEELSGAFAQDMCPFVAYMRWMETSIKAGEQ